MFYCLNGYSQICSGDFSSHIFTQNFGLGNFNFDEQKGTISLNTINFGAHPFVQNFTNSFENNSYWITNDASIINKQFLKGDDHHAANPPNKKGNFVVFAGTKEKSTYFEILASTACIKENYRLSIGAGNPVSKEITPTNRALFSVQIIDDASQTLIRQFDAPALDFSDDSLEWLNFNIDFTAISSNTRIIIFHPEQSQESLIAFDDIQLSKCTPKTFEISATKNPLCIGENLTLSTDYQSTEKVYFQWQELNGQNWVDIKNANTSTYTHKLTTQSANNYRILIAPSAAEIHSDCAVISAPLSIQIAKNTVSLGADTTICGAYTLLAKGNSEQIRWFKNDNLLENEHKNSLKITTSGTYKYIAANDQGCIAEDEIEIIIRPKPTVQIDSILYFCEGNTAIVNPKNNDTKQVVKYQWFKGGNKITEGAVFTTKEAGNYTLRASNNTGCFTDYAFTVVKEPLPKVTTAQTHFEVCVNEKQALQVQSEHAVKFEWFKNNIKIENDSTNVLMANGQGVYKVIGYNKLGCKSNEIQFTVQALPLPSNVIKVRNQTIISDNIVHICQGENVIAEAVSSARKISWFKDNNPKAFSDTSQIVITESGTYKAMATSQIGCTFVQEIKVQVHEKPQISIEGAAEICQGETNILNAKVTNQKGSFSYRWYKKDNGGGFETLDERSSTIKIKDGFTYKVLVINTQGCSDEKEFTTKINPTPNANFSVPGGVLYDDTDIQFEERVQYSGNKDELVYLWDFGDGTTSNEANPKHRFPGNKTGESRRYEVKLTVISPKGCSSSGKSSLLTHNSERPVGRANAALPGCGRRNVQFFDNSIPARIGGKIIAWHWDFGDGSTSTLQNPVHTFKNDGIHTIILRTTDALNGISPVTTLSRLTIYLNPTPVANFEANSNVCLNEPFIVSNRSKINFGFITKWIWDFGDGTVIVKNNGSPTSHFYKTPGEKTVKLRVETPQVCFSEITKKIIIEPLPEVDFNIPDTVCMNEIFTIDGIKNDHTIKWIWDMNDGSKAIEKDNDEPFTYKFTKSGLKTVILKAVNNLGCIEFKEKSILVKEVPISNFKISNQITCIGQRIHVDRISSENIIKWIWETSEGPLEHGNKSFDYTFKSIGQHFIRLTVINTLGCLDTFEIPITITAIPKAKFSIKDQFWMVNQEVVINDESTVDDNLWNLISYQWNMGDGATIFGQKSLKYAYSKSGNYEVKLTTTNQQGCGTSYTQNFTVYDYPKAQFEINNARVCDNNSVIFRDQSTIGNNKATRLVWYYDYKKGAKADEVVDNPKMGQTYTHRYSYQLERSSTVIVRLVIYAKTGDSSVFEKEVRIEPLPKLAFSPIHDICINSGIYQIREAKELLGLSGKGIFSGKGVSEDGFINPYKMGPGIHEITYTFVSIFGCTKQISQTVSILPSPEIEILQSIEVFENEEFQLHPRYRGHIIAYHWEPQTGIDDTSSPNPKIRLKEDQTLYITAVNNLGCPTTKEIHVKVFKEIISYNAFSPNGDGINDVWNVPNLQKYMQKAKLEIFNRSGTKVHEQIGYDQPWDGRSNGVYLPVGTYFYKITKSMGQKVLSGSVTIMK